jgi:hypothetical protein
VPKILKTPAIQELIKSINLGYLGCQQLGRVIHIKIMLGVNQQRISKLQPISKIISLWNTLYDLDPG